jgi:hypothetical protein
MKETCVRTDVTPWVSGEGAPIGRAEGEMESSIVPAKTEITWAPVGFWERRSSGVRIRMKRMRE